ncbi:tRNA (adenosine(37)-N6)-threonylcarbamoyltransferase complex dimerization subunit type 1 TsaB [Candidatus Symbiobacter mobilis]|uniref:Molecular chaperone n=1 Tax=Candidatus Symbiobacter mobilis CR TaxID=946483 RepID=U5N824_9BURK|nr:tRNA (adenosine(37)-N6)-threonylcarbamoyltransferase complex dimerization subunit type 1 TsaB [Candidatus Symbiobacter mobilis]AGX87711.1 molecular chaperone [Candidatus Symbiobacter mobilis CR]
MHLLAIETSTPTQFVAVQRGDGAPPWQHEAPAGAQASQTLIPTIQSLLDQAGLAFSDLDAIVFGAGPGAFTGLRTACSVAQGLAFALSLPVLPIPSLLAVAETARHNLGHTGVYTVCAMLDARMDEVYHAVYRYDGSDGPHEHSGTAWRQRSPIALARPELVQADCDAWAGNALAVYGERLAHATPWHNALPTALALLRLAPERIARGEALPADQALPLYVRDKVALTTQERAKP